MKRYKNIYSHDDDFFTEHGSKFHFKKQLDYKDNGGVFLRITGEIPTYDLIQSHRSSCELESVLKACYHDKQFAVSSVDDVNELIADFTFTSNLGELYSTTKRFEYTWSNLPIEVREQFGSDIKQFIRGVGSADFDSKLHVGFTSFNESLLNRLDKQKEHLVPLPDKEPTSKSSDVSNSGGDTIES